MGNIEDLKFYLTCLAVIASWIGVFFSYRNYRRAQDSLQLAKYQEQKKESNLVLYLSEGMYKVKDNNRLYAFCLSISNKSDTNNSIVKIELRVTYITKENACMKIRLESNPKLATMYSSKQESCFDLPKVINSHNSINGWVLFGIDKNILSNSIIERYDLLVFDSHNDEYSIRPIILHEQIE